MESSLAPCRYRRYCWRFSSAAKLDNIMYFKAKQLRHSKMPLLQKQCELERTHILNLMMLALQKPRLAGYMSTWTIMDELVGYITALRRFHLLKDSKNFDRVPILCNRQTMFVDPFNRWTLPFTNEIHCQRHTNMRFILILIVYCLGTNLRRLHYLSRLALFSHHQI